MDSRLPAGAVNTPIDQAPLERFWDTAGSMDSFLEELRVRVCKINTILMGASEPKAGTEIPPALAIASGFIPGANSAITSLRSKAFDIGNELSKLESFLRA